MREDGKRNFLGIVMGGCGRYVFFFFFSFFWKGWGGMGMGMGLGLGMVWFRDGMECMMYDV